MGAFIHQKSLASLSIVELVEHVLNGEKDVYEELINRNTKSVQYCVWNFVRNAALVEDLTQDTFLKGYTSLESLKEPNKFKSWILRIARNICLDFCKRKKVIVAELETIEKIGMHRKESEASAIISRNMMEEAMKKLPSLTAEALWMRFAESLPYSEMAKITNTSESVLRKRVSRGLASLSEHI